MLEVICFCLVVFMVQGHTDISKTDAELQSALMPQELNPVFVSEKDSPMRAFLPLERFRRNSDLSLETTYLTSIKRYSRVIACVVLVLSAAIEIILYFIDAYYGG